MFQTLRDCAIAVLLFACGSAPAAELKLLPADVTLTGPHANQRLVLVAEEGGHVVADRSPDAKFASSKPSVATVDERGVVRPVGDGEAVIMATHGDSQATAHVKVVRANEAAPFSFTNDVIPLLTKAGCNSGACHGALAGKGGLKLSLRGYDPDADHFVLTRQALGRRIDRQEPAKSLVLLKPTTAVPHGGGLRIDVDSDDYRLLSDWVASGAPGPRADEPRLERIEAFPAEAVLKPKGRVQVLVRARYSDGHTQDVTHAAKFNSTEELVAAVDAEGRVRVTGHGEAAVTVWYANRVAVARVTVPLPGAVDPKVLAEAPRNNYIDDLVMNKMRALNVPPSPPCTDAEFIRRAFLDATGTLPTPDEVRKFVADPAKDKRARLVDDLLKRPEFVDYWAYKWSDLLLVSTRKLPQQAVWSFHQYVRQAVADNVPWDRFARDILTARGSDLDNGAAGYFVIHKDVSDLTEATAVTFLGMSVTCCRCHNHPLEKWTQDQYWSLANLFSRVALKNGDRGGEVIVQELPFGDVPHPRRGVAMLPAPLDGKPLPPDSGADRRTYFADWLTSPDNPYFARALVNRVWRNFLGRGLVEAEDDLRQTNPPTNEELFAALEKDFVAHKYDVRQLIRTIMTSATYQRSSRPRPGNETDDRFYSHYLIRRLPAEVILDAYSQVTGVPTPFDEVALGSTGGTAKTGAYPVGTRALQLPDTLVVSRFLDSFGRPERGQTCSCERQEDSSVGQALHLNNGKTLNDKLRARDSRAERWLNEKVSDAEAVKRLYMLALCREPKDEELKKFADLMARGERREVMEDLFWAVLTGREFLFNR
ncbi:MAG TPA: DUF1549 and DUF1553 domain-containing protein [Gemmataceae bacterium]|nr:DUF1549 and DUF1553 domain-containing protein [Gemmataceae bacterium]